MDLYQFLSHYDSLINVDHVLTITKTRTEEQLLQLHWTTQFKHMIMRMNHKNVNNMDIYNLNAYLGKTRKNIPKIVNFTTP